MGIAGAVLIPVGVGALTAVWGIVSQRIIARRRATFDYIASGERDREIIDGFSPKCLAQLGTTVTESSPSSVGVIVRDNVVPSSANT